MLSPAGRPSAGVDAGEFAGFGVAIDGEQVAAQAAHHGFHQGKDGIRGDGGIDGGPATRQNLRAGLGSERLAGGDDSALRHHHRSGLPPFLREGCHNEG